MTERFRRSWLRGWVHSSEGFSVRILGRNNLQYRDADGELQVFVEPLAKFSDIVVSTGAIPDLPNRPRDVVVQRLQRVFDHQGWRFIRADADAE